VHTNKTNATTAPTTASPTSVTDTDSVVAIPRDGQQSVNVTFTIGEWVQVSVWGSAFGATAEVAFRRVRRGFVLPQGCENVGSRRCAGPRLFCRTESTQKRRRLPINPRW